jgi:hypothetical protein
LLESCEAYIFDSDIYSSVEDGSDLTSIFITPFHAAQGTGKDEWPFDNGDDPSFRAALERGGQLSWGVCRQDVRNKLREGDIVVFFSFSREQPSDYRFCSVATVKCRVSQADVWREQDLGQFREYCNLLVRPIGTSEVWKHVEPCLKGSPPHTDWLWRTTSHAGLKKERFMEIYKSEQFRPGRRIGGHVIDFAPNYILFSSDSKQTRIVRNPPFVATHAKDWVHEKWNEDAKSQAIKNLILGEADRINGKERWLRTENKYRPHRQVRFELSEEEAEYWRERLMRLVDRD